MEAIELLRNRHSASKLGAPAPSAEAVDAMLEAAARAPDHGRLQPWRLILIEGDARRSFGEILADSLARRNPLAGEPVLARERVKALRAPSSLLSRRDAIDPGRFRSSSRSSPPAAQLTAFMLAAFAQGFGAFWRTGEAAYDEAVKGALGVGSEDLIVGFIYVGTDSGDAPSRSRPVVQELAHRWAADGHKSADPWGT
jgi:nitroreductase